MMVIIFRQRTGLITYKTWSMSKNKIRRWTMQYVTGDRVTSQFFFRAGWKKSYVSLRLKPILWQQYKDCWKISVSTYKIRVNDEMKTNKLLLKYWACMMLRQSFAEYQKVY